MPLYMNPNKSLSSLQVNEVISMQSVAGVNFLGSRDSRTGIHGSTKYGPIWVLFFLTQNYESQIII